LTRLFRTATPRVFSYARTQKPNTGGGHTNDRLSSLALFMGAHLRDSPLPWPRPPPPRDPLEPRARFIFTAEQQSRGPVTGHGNPPRILPRLANGDAPGDGPDDGLHLRPGEEDRLEERGARVKSRALRRLSVRGVIDSPARRLPGRLVWLHSGVIGTGRRIDFGLAERVRPPLSWNGLFSLGPAHVVFYHYARVEISAAR
jgi:hypothetical protein